MSFNGSGTFVINSTGQPVVYNTVIDETVFNAFTADIATGLTTCLTKDGQSTPTANIPMGGFKITGLAVATGTGDALSYGRAATLGATMLIGDLLFTDATYDIGKSGATRPRDIFMSRNLTVGGTTTFTGNIVSDLLFTDATYDIGKTGATRPRDGFFSRNLTVGGTLGVTGTASLAALTATAATINPASGAVGLTVSGNGTGVAGSFIGTTTAEALDVSGPNSAGASFGLKIVAGTNSSDYAIKWKNAGGTDQGTFWGSGGVTIGAAAVDQGAGTINVTSNIYKGGSAYTNPDYVFEHWATGTIEKFADNEGASEYRGLPPVAELRDHCRREMHLPGFGKKLGLFDGGDALLLNLEQAHLYIFELEDRISAMERRLSAAGI